MSDTTIQNLQSYDPFADADDIGQTQGQAGGSANSDAKKIHIRIQQRNGRKTLTTVQGIPEAYDLKKILKVIKKQFACNGTIVQDEDNREVIQLQGDQRNNMSAFLTDKGAGLGIENSKIQKHGF